MRRAFDIDILACPRCGNRGCACSTIEDRRVVEQILTHLVLLNGPVRADPVQPPAAANLFAATFT